MASVSVNSGEITATLHARHVPVSKWPELVEKRHWFSQVTLTADCRYVARFVSDADEMWEALGYKNADDLIANGYGLEPEEIRLVAAWLELNDPEEAVPLNDAVDKAKRNQHIHALRSEGHTQQAIADEVGLSREGVAKVLVPQVPKDKNARQFGWMPKDPATAAAKIRDRFGGEFAGQLFEAGRDAMK